MMYKLNLHYITKQPCSVNKITEDGSIVSIPFDEANTDYQEYLKWLAEGNTPLPAITEGNNNSAPLNMETN